MHPHRCCGVLVAVVTVVLATACGRSVTIDTATPPAPGSSATSSAVPAAAGAFVPRYEAATSEAARTGEQLARELMLLETLTRAADGIFTLPRDIPVIGKECGFVNAFYQPDEQAVTMCYEFLTDVARGPTVQAAGARADELFLNVNAMVFFHELGHMAIDIFQLPATGREEDNADQLGVLALLGDGTGGQAVLDAAQWWFDASAGARPTLAEFADEHSLNEQRGFNLVCWVYGSDPDAYPGLVAPAGVLPADRAAKCPTEFNQIYTAWITLLSPYLQTGAGDNMAPS